MSGSPPEPVEDSESVPDEAEEAAEVVALLVELGREQGVRDLRSLEEYPELADRLGDLRERAGVPDEVFERQVLAAIMRDVRTDAPDR